MSDTVRIRFFPAAFGVWVLGLLCGGCVAVNVGRPETIEHVERRNIVDAAPVAVSVEDARVQLRQTGNLAEVQVYIDVREEYPLREHVKRVVVRKQKRLAFGLFPGTAELVWMPEGALASGMMLSSAGAVTSPEFSRVYENGNPGMGTYAFYQLVMTVAPVPGFVPVVSTVESLLITPFYPWNCGADVYDPEFFRRDEIVDGKVVAVASGSPKLRALAALPEKEKTAVGANTCFDPQSGGLWGHGHLGWFGFHKYSAIFVDLPPEEQGKAVGRETRLRKVLLEGPFEAELSIPGVRHSQTKTVPRGERKVLFDLPPGNGGGAMDAIVRIRECGEGGGVSRPGRMAIRKLSGQNSVFPVTLSSTAPRDIDGEYRIVEIRPESGGRYAVRVEVFDEERVLDVALAIEAEVRRRIREDYARRHPGGRTEDVRDQVEWRRAEGRRNVLEFTGHAFSVRPLGQGWRYDPETRRGVIRMAVSPDMSGEELVRWARENVGNILADKNIALKVGAEVPAGARFEFLGARFADGILAVAFRALE